jgi:hypothetical protein
MLLSLVKGLQFISIGIDEDESGLVCLLDFLDLDFFGGLLYFDLDLDLDFSSLELLSFFSFCSPFSLGDEDDLFICLSFSLVISFSLSSGLIKLLLSIFSLLLSFSFSSFSGPIIFSFSFSMLLFLF